MSEYQAILCELNHHLPRCLIMFTVLPYIDFYEYERREVVNELNYKFRYTKTSWSSSWSTLGWYREHPERLTLKHWINTRLFYKNTINLKDEHVVSNELRMCYQYTCPNPFHSDNKNKPESKSTIELDQFNSGNFYIALSSEHQPSTMYDW